MLDAQVDPLLNQALEALIGRDLFANAGDPLRTDIVRVTPHPTGVADLPVGADAFGGNAILARQSARAHWADLLEGFFDPADPPLDLTNPLLAHRRSFPVGV